MLFSPSPSLDAASLQPPTMKIEFEIEIIGQYDSLRPRVLVPLDRYTPSPPEEEVNFVPAFLLTVQKEYNKSVTSSAELFKETFA